jgi:predicted dehydrogenase/dTDP-4-amino-4,6-dideoxygalactose transaminase
VALVDVDPETLLIDPDRVEAAIVPGRTRAILPVHLFGQTADMERLRAIARRHGLALIEDAAQAVGAVHALGRPGTLGDAAAFSFQAFKNLASGEGGALVTDDDEVFERAWRLHDVGRPRIGGERWLHESLGWNVRPSEYVAAVLLHRLARVEAEQELRARRFAQLRAELAELGAVRPLALAPGLVRHGAHMFVLRYRPEACDGLVLADYLAAVRAEGVPAAPLYGGMTQSEQPALRRLAAQRPDWLRVLPTPVAQTAVRELVWLPHDLLLGSAEDVSEIAAAFRKVERRYRPTRAPQPVPDAMPPHALAAAAHAPRAVRRDGRLRVGLVGAGAMGRLHADALARSSALCLTAVADVSVEAAARIARTHGGRVLASAEALVASDEVDVVLVAVPHRQHPEVALPALHRGLHVVCEKPLAVTVDAADELVRAAAQSRGLFAVVHQNRLEPAFVEARRLIRDGGLGAPYRASLVESAWRTLGYFRAAPWRATWHGEGGGVLVNQAPHVLDRYAWLAGMPERVLARCDTNLHPIEVEDTASALLFHKDGLHGHVHVSTTEAPAVSRTTLACDRGRVEILDGRLFVTRLARPISEAARDDGSSSPLAGETREICVARLGTIPAQLDAFWADFASAATRGTSLACPGAEGLWAVELANAIHLSSERRAEVALPLARDEVTRWMASKLGPRAVESA